MCLGTLWNVNPEIVRSIELVQLGKTSGVHNVRGCAEEPLAIATRGLQIAGRDAARTG